MHPCRWDPPEGFGAPAPQEQSASEWAEVVDSSSGKSYYYNATTGVTSWDPPPGFVSANAAAGASGSGVAGGVAKTGEEPAGTVRLVVVTISAVVAIVSTGDARCCFICPISGAVHRPALPAPRSPCRPSSSYPSLQKKNAAARKGMLGRRGQIAKRSTAKPQTVGEKLATRAKKFVAMRKAEKAKSQPSACECHQPSLPHGRAARALFSRVVGHLPAPHSFAVPATLPQLLGSAPSVAPRRLLSWLRQLCPSRLRPRLRQLLPLRRRQIGKRFRRRRGRRTTIMLLRGRRPGRCPHDRCSQSTGDSGAQSWKRVMLRATPTRLRLGSRMYAVPPLLTG